MIEEEEVEEVVRRKLRACVREKRSSSRHANRTCGVTRERGGASLLSAAVAAVVLVITAKHELDRLRRGAAARRGEGQVPEHHVLPALHTGDTACCVPSLLAGWFYILSSFIYLFFFYWGN